MFSKEQLQRWGKLGGLVALGVVVFVALSLLRKPPKRRPLEETGKPVRVLTVTARDVVPHATGYGVVSAKRQWQMIAQVSGRVLDMHELLKVGAVIPEGTELLRIDPKDYQLAANRQTASVAGIRAQIQQLKTQQKSVEANLAIEKRSLELAERELERVRELYRSGSGSQSDVDAAERQVLTQRKAVQSLKNQLAEIPANRAVLAAQIQESSAGLEGAKLDIERTELVAPFDIRVRALNVRERDVVGANQVIAETDGIDAAEVTAQMSLGAIRPLIPFRPQAEPIKVTAEMMAKLPELLGLEAVVKLESGGVTARRKAELDRFTAMDPTTRTMGVVVVVQEPYTAGKGGAALVPGMYVEVELSGKKRSGCLAIPRSALHHDTVHVVDPDKRLQTRKVVVDITQAHYVCIREGLAEGDTVVLTTLSPAIEGMLLDPRPDDGAAERLAELSAGEVQP